MESAYLAFRRGINNELVGRAFRNGVGCGIVSILADFDHIWSQLGIEEPVNYTGWIGRPLHHPIIFLCYALLYAAIATAIQVKRGASDFGVSTWKWFIAYFASCCAGLWTHLRSDGMFIFLWGINI